MASLDQYVAEVEAQMKLYGEMIERGECVMQSWPLPDGMTKEQFEERLSRLNAPLEYD